MLCTKISCLAFSFLPISDTEKNIYSLEEPMIGKYLIDMSTAGFIFLVLIFFWETISWRLRTFLNQYIYFGIYKRYRKVSTQVWNNLRTTLRELKIRSERYVSIYCYLSQLLWSQLLRKLGSYLMKEKSVSTRLYFLNLY